MTLETPATERAKLDDLLRLSRQQVTALEQGDQKDFEIVLLAKRALINSFTDARSLVEADPTLQAVVREIQECDQTALRLLYRRIGRVMRELSELQQAKKARSAYHNARSDASRRSYPFQADTPRFIDQQT